AGRRVEHEPVVVLRVDVAHRDPETGAPAGLHVGTNTDVARGEGLRQCEGGSGRARLQHLRDFGPGRGPLTVAGAGPVLRGPVVVERVQSEDLRVEPPGVRTGE